MNKSILPTLLVCTALSGCGTLIQKALDDDGNKAVSAAQIQINPSDLLAAQSADDTGKKEFLGKIVFASEVSCNEFLNRIVLGENTINVTGDVLGTALSTLSTAFVPTGTKTALSAGAAIATGSKTAIDADIYAKAATSDFAKAIQQTYYASIKDYTDQLPKLASTKDTPLILTNEIAKIESYHAMCALAPAESSIQAKLAQPSVPVAPNAPSGNAQNLVGSTVPQVSSQHVEGTHAAIPGSVY